jgi:hypothetical protein
MQITSTNPTEVNFDINIIVLKGFGIEGHLLASVGDRDNSGKTNQFQIFPSLRRRGADSYILTSASLLFYQYFKALHTRELSRRVVRHSQIYLWGLPPFARDQSSETTNTVRENTFSQKRIQKTARRVPRPSPKQEWVFAPRLPRPLPTCFDLNFKTTCPAARYLPLVLTCSNFK